MTKKCSQKHDLVRIIIDDLPFCSEICTETDIRFSADSDLNGLDILYLPSGKVVCISDEYVGLYNSVDDMLEDDGTKCINGFWIEDKREEV